MRSVDAYVQSEIRKMEEQQKADCIIKLIETMTRREEAMAASRHMMPVPFEAMTPSLREATETLHQALLDTGDPEAIQLVIAERYINLQLRKVLAERYMNLRDT